MRRFTDRGPARLLEGWQKVGDPRLWKLIVSPEFGDRVSLDDLTRDLMHRMEQDLGTKLQWTAVPHFNTEHPHVHIALRGVGTEGRQVGLSRDYIRGGIREVAENLCTRQLGYRTKFDAADAQRNIRQVAGGCDLMPLLDICNRPLARPDAIQKIASVQIELLL